MKRSRMMLALAPVLVAALLLAGCGESDPGAIGPQGVDGGLSGEGARQEYIDGVGRALQQLGTSQGDSFAKAIDAGNARQLQAAAIAWDQGGEQLQSLDPPKDASAAHLQLVKAVKSLSVWNQRIAKAAPNKVLTRKLGKQASASPASQSFEAAVCGIVDAGYEVIDPAACSPLSNADGPSS